jgi:glycosyltransferase involved in cell wall biosynthesis
VINLVSLCVVTYNEAHRIAETLTDAAPYVDEIVVVDQSSTDHTTGIITDWYNSNSKNPTTKIINDIHWGYCEPSRKLAHQHSTGDWILVLDADESISSDFAREMRTIDERGYEGVKLKRSLWISGEHRFTGDYQYRYYHRNSARYLDEIHTEPQPTIHKTKIYSPDYVGIMHQKSWVEQIRDELAYEEILQDVGGIDGERKRALNVHLALIREAGITPEEADSLTIEERINLGIGVDVNA